ncbi:MAG TPA: DUF2076 domain-containing protein [Pseudolabrys sp.]|nr:DUF2076 domain-containing protein [Pseudolabrys sp.]
MTPQERQLVDELFDRLARLESAPRDAQAQRAIEEGLARAPNAIYPLVQTVLVQDEALKRADARIRELAGEDANAPAGGFLDSMRQALTGRGSATSVPSVRPAAPDPRWNSGVAFAPAAASPGGSFLGTAAASAAGVIGGALLLNTISSMFGHHGGNAFAAMPPANSPWDNSAAGSDLAREAGFDDIGRGARANAQPAQLFDNDDVPDSPDIDADFDGDTSGDFGGDFGGGDSA